MCLLISGVLQAQLPTITGYTKINSRYSWMAGNFGDGLHVPQYNGVPTDRTGVWMADGSIAADTLNGHFYYRNGGVWVRVAKYSDILAGALRFGVSGEDTRATAARYFSGGGQTFTLDSLAATDINTRTTSPITIRATNGVDTAMLTVVKGSLPSQKKFETYVTLAASSAYSKLTQQGGSIQQNVFVSGNQVGSSHVGNGFVSLEAAEPGGRNGYIYNYVDSIKLQPGLGNLFIDTLLQSVTPTGKMMVWDSVTQLVTTRAIPSGGGITVGTTTITSGTDTRVPFNDGGVYGEDAGLTYNKTTNFLSAGGVTLTENSTLTKSQAAATKWTISNTSAAAGAESKVDMVTDVATSVFGAYGSGQSYGAIGAGMMYLYNDLAAGGIAFMAAGASGTIRFATGGNTEVARFASNGEPRMAFLAGSGSRAVLADAEGDLSAPVSDRSTKENIRPLQTGISKIMQLRPVLFEYKDEFKNYGKGVQVGFIAQDIQQVLPNSVYTNFSNGKMGYNEIDIVPLLVRAVQEQQKMIEDLREEIKKLKRK